MILPDGFKLEERYVDREVAMATLEEYEEIMSEMFCPFSKGKCKANCMFLSDGSVKAQGDGTFVLELPICSVFLGGQG